MSYGGSSKTREVSGRLLEMAGIKRRITEPGMTVTLCDEYGDDLYALEHPWSVEGLTNEQFDTGMQNLRTALGENGWKVREGEVDGADRPELHASNETEHFSVKITAHRAEPGKEPVLGFSVASRCYRAASHAAANNA
ncbi:hypothetical protein ACIGBH_07710 [Streptomyces sp. NPDC085929]|uniref:hypothetical protein n=1 Tax=Streptomyces sp. NPDC085929 TaxID=3365739 RepID=UPI0037D719E3